VRREGNHIRITAELIKADDGFQLWSQTYDREIKDIFAVQDEISRAATATLKLKLSGGNGQPIDFELAQREPRGIPGLSAGKLLHWEGAEQGRPGQSPHILRRCY